MSLPTFDFARCPQYLHKENFAEQILTMFVESVSAEYQTIQQAFRLNDNVQVKFLLTKFLETTLYCGTPQLTAMLREATQQTLISTTTLESIALEIDKVKRAINSFLVSCAVTS